jgi:hypothetical protein
VNIGTGCGDGTSSLSYFVGQGLNLLLRRFKIQKHSYVDEYMFSYRRSSLVDCLVK